MYFVTFNVDGAERTGRTEVFAGSTAYAHLLVDGRDADR